MSNICQRCKLNPTNGRKHCEACLEFFRNYYQVVRKRDAVTLGVCITCSKPKGKAKGLPERVKSLFVNAEKQIEGLKSTVDELNEQIEYCRTLNQQLLSEKAELSNQVNYYDHQINKLMDKINELEREKFYSSETEQKEMLE